MQGYELVTQVQKERSEHPDRPIIKWWRKEEDYIDFDLVARFLETVNPSSEIAGFELIDQEELWQTVQTRCQGRVSRVQRDGRWVLLWSPSKGAEIEEKCSECPYTPDMLLKILDAETNSNFVD